MKKTFLISRLLLYSLLIASSFSFLVAQQFEWTDDAFPGSTFMEVFEINGELYGAVSNGPLLNYFSNYLYQLSIYKIELTQGESGFILDEIATIPFLDNFATIAIDYIEATKVWILVQSSFIAANRQLYRVMLYDEDFDFITEQTIDTFFQFQMAEWSIKVSSHHYHSISVINRLDNERIIILSGNSKRINCQNSKCCIILLEH